MREYEGGMRVVCGRRGLGIGDGMYMVCIWHEHGKRDR
jgi:hypothetical protein